MKWNYEIQFNNQSKNGMKLTQICQKLQEIQTKEAEYDNVKFWGAHQEDLLRNLKGFDQRPSAGWRK